MNQRSYQQCSMSVMDTISDPDIRFDEKGISNYYYEYKKAESGRVLTGDAGIRKVKELVEKIKESGNNKPYDSIMGLSGGVDSSYLAYLAKQNGLRPLVVHFDNGWNSELAVKNIETMVTKLGFDLYTLVVNWEEFRDIQLSYIKASVIDIEVVTDHAISGTIARLIKEYGIKYSLTGSNVVTEEVMPPSWIFNKNDHVNLLDIHRQYGSRPIRTYPIYDTYLKKYTHNYLKTESLALLNYVPYNKEEIKKLIGSELGWRDYGGKHYESVFTKFYQAYILPVKFQVDKRKAHLSNLIFSGQITKEQALDELNKPLYPEKEFKADYEFVLKKLELSSEDFEKLMSNLPRQHSEFKTERPLDERYKILKPFKQVYKSIGKFRK